MVLSGWTQEGPADIVDDDAVGGARWGGVVCGGGAAAAEGGARVYAQLNYARDHSNFCLQNFFFYTY